MIGIESAGAYAPRLRISAEEFEDAWGRHQAPGVYEKAVLDADEDALTMAFEAARRALSAADRDGDDVAFLAFATTTPPLAEEDLTPRLGEFLDVPATATRHSFTGSTRAGTRALIAARAAGPWDDGVGLVVAADCPQGEPDSEVEHAAGAGAAAFVLSPDGRAELTSVAEYAADYPGTRFRRRGDDAVSGLGVTQYDRQAFTETLANAVSELEVDSSSSETGESSSHFDAAAVQAPNGKLPYRTAGPLGVSTDAIQTCATVHELGDTGAASVPLSLARALEDGSETVLAAAFGSGAAADALFVDAGGDVPTLLSLDGTEQLDYAAYLRRRGELTDGEPDGGGAYVSVPSWRRTLPQRYRLVAGRCAACDALNFPPEGACSACRTLTEYEDVTLPGTGTVEAVTTIEQGGAPPEFSEQQARSGGFPVAIVAFDGPDGTGDGDGDGETASAPSQVVGGTDDVEIGDRVAATIRRIYTQEGVTRYGFKVQSTD